MIPPQVGDCIRIGLSELDGYNRRVRQVISYDPQTTRLTYRFWDVDRPSLIDYNNVLLNVAYQYGWEFYPEQLMFPEGI